MDQDCRREEKPVMRMIANLLQLVLLSLSLLLIGCSSTRLMMPTPNLYIDSKTDPYLDLPDELKNSEVELFYLTDRLPEQDGEAGLRYGYGRSRSMALGTAVVDLGVDMTWDDLLQASRSRKRTQPVKMEMGKVTELARGPQSPIPYALVDGEVMEEPTLLKDRDRAAELFQRTLIQRLSQSPRKEVFIYIHGFHNTFEDAAYAMAELWHFLGRIGVPIIYTWPAGRPGLSGYSYDRESSEFTVYHLREAIGLIASIPEVEKIHLIAHSRGTDVAVTALRELTLRTRAAGIDPRSKFKIHNFVLAAPDLDIMVAEQRIDGDKLALSTRRFTMYTSSDDRAIGISGRLFRSPQGRVGTFSPENLTDYQREMARYYDGSNFAVIQFPGASSAYRSRKDHYGHSYFRNAPAVSSDLILMLRDDLDPGAPGRPLDHVDQGFYIIPPGYPDRIQETGTN
jgi:esterase/lipase superfamily enzyme